VRTGLDPVAIVDQNEHTAKATVRFRNTLLSV
jgi:hypothetical protein